MSKYFLLHQHGQSKREHNQVSFAKAYENSRTSNGSILVNPGKDWTTLFPQIIHYFVIGWKRKRDQLLSV